MANVKKPTPRYQPSPRRGGSGNGRLLPIALGAAAAAVVVAVIVAVALPAIGQNGQGGGQSDQQKPLAQPASVSFAAVGDNLPDEFIAYYADSLAGERDDGHYDYSPIFEPIKHYIQDADLAYIDEETHIGGDEIGPSGYPSFNTTDEMATAIVDTGFDLVASATNHSFDYGIDALTHSVNLWETQPVAFTGTALTEEQYNRIPVVERNGITFALLNYTYGINYDIAQLPQYAVNFIDEARITADVKRAHEMADVVLVSMHWGTELLMEADEDQLHYAQLLADLDVDVVLGSHPHVIGPMAWVSNAANPDHRTLVIYSLGNFLADHESPSPESALEGMVTCDFVRAEAGGAVSVENVRWIPLICHGTEDRSNFAVYPVNEYPLSLAKQNRSLIGLDNPLYWLCEKTYSVVGPEWF